MKMIQHQVHDEQASEYYQHLRANVDADKILYGRLLVALSSLIVQVTKF
jgi:hypothetical protein